MKHFYTNFSAIIRSKITVILFINKCINCDKTNFLSLLLKRLVRCIMKAIKAIDTYN